MTSSVAYYSTDARKNEIYLLSVQGSKQFVFTRMIYMNAILSNLLNVESTSEIKP